MAGLRGRAKKGPVHEFKHLDGSQPHCCVDGVYRSNVTMIGYCWCRGHKGYLTPALYREHDCGNKNCRFFQKYEDAEYWKQLDEKRFKRESWNTRERVKKTQEANMLRIAQRFTSHIQNFRVESVERLERGTFKIDYIALDKVTLEEETRMIKALTAEKICFNKLKRSNTHIKKVFGVYTEPDELRKFMVDLKNRAYDNKIEVQVSDVVGCYACLYTYPSELVTSFRTTPTAIFGIARCPFCSAETVIPESEEEFDLDEALLYELNQYWRNGIIRSVNRGRGNIRNK